MNKVANLDIRNSQDNPLQEPHLCKSPKLRVRIMSYPSWEKETERSCTIQKTFKMFFLTNILLSMRRSHSILVYDLITFNEHVSVLQW